jgi:hypothetical protein
MIPENQLLCFGAQGWIWESEPPAPKEKPRTKAQEKNQSRSLFSPFFWPVLAGVLLGNLPPLLLLMMTRLLG